MTEAPLRPLPGTLPEPFTGPLPGPQPEHSELVSSFPGKVDLLQAQFFPEPDPADLSDIPPTHPPANEGHQWEVIEEEVAQVIQCLPNKKAPGTSRVPNIFLKAMGSLLVIVLTLLTQACLDWEHYSQAFKTALTAAL